jgi:TolA-binding protein
MRAIGVTLATCFLLSLPAGAMTLEERLQFADGLYTRGIHDMAAKEYTAILSSNPKGTHVDQVLFRRGECYRLTDDRVGADKDFRRVYMEFVQSEFRFRAGFRRADLYREAGRDSEAAALYAAVLKDKPPADVASACVFFTAETQRNRKQFAEAAATLEQLRKNYPKSRFDSYALLKLAELYAGELEQADKALSLYAAASERPATDRIGAEALFLLADLHFSRKEYERSAERFGALLKKYPQDVRVAESRMKAGWAAYYAGRYADAISHIEGASEQVGDDRSDEWLYLRANCERQLLRNEPSTVTYQRLIDSAPDSKYAQAARYELALVHYKTGRFKDAIAQAEQVDVSGELARDVYWLLGESHAALEHQDEAIQYYRLVSTKFPESNLAADASYRLAHLLQKRGEYQEAARYFGKTARDFPDADTAPKALFASAICLQKLKRHDEAARDWAQLVSDYGDHPLAQEALYQKGMSEMRMERMSDATASFRSLLDRYPKSDYRVDALYWRGTLLAQGEQYEDAETEFRMALKAKPRRELEREIRFGLAMALYHRDQLKEAADLFGTVLDTPVRERFSPPLLRWLAEYHLQQKAYDRAAQPAQLLVDAAASDVWTQSGWVLVGRCALGRGDKRGARDAFEKANALPVSGPFAAEAALKLGELVLAADAAEAANALLYFQRAASLAGADGQLSVRAHAYAGMGEASEAAGDAEAAARYYMSVAILYDDAELVPQCLFRAATAFSSVSQTNAAKQAVAELRERYPESEWAKKVEVVAPLPEEKTL